MSAHRGLARLVSAGTQHAPQAVDVLMRHPEVVDHGRGRAPLTWLPDAYLPAGAKRVSKVTMRKALSRTAITMAAIPGALSPAGHSRDQPQDEGDDLERHDESEPR